MIDDVSGGALVDKTPSVRKLIATMVANSQYFEVKKEPKRVNEVSTFFYSLP